MIVPPRPAGQDRDCDRNTQKQHSHIEELDLLVENHVVVSALPSLVTTLRIFRPECTDLLPFLASELLRNSFNLIQPEPQQCSLTLDNRRADFGRLDRKSVV